MEKKGIYIHVPFCRKKCSYCDFYLITNLNILPKFLECLKSEIEMSSGNYGKDEFDSIFIGGGTPSILNSKKISEIIENINKNFTLSGNTEITIESNPEDFIINPLKLKELRNAGINRLSIGVESFNDSELLFLTREHTSSQAIKVLENAKKYFDNISIDIIYSLPGQKLTDLDKSVETAIQLDIPHISAYTLIFEKETKLYKDLLKKKIKQQSEYNESEFYSKLNLILNNSGYVHYEVSNYSKQGFKSCHNLKYWNYIDYIGFGPSAHSFYSGKRWNNYKNVIKYMNSLKNGVLPIENSYSLTIDESVFEFIMLGLRAEGIEFDRFRNYFHINFIEKYKSSITELINNDLAILNHKNFRLNEKGYSIADEIISRYF
jgi:oxygen-independent coproporphyrinogen III oxidase